MSRALLALFGFAVVAACAPRSLDWGVSFADPALEGRAVHIQARIYEGACPGADLVYSTELYAGTEGEEGPRLEPGTHCFSARASDGSCVTFASGSVEVSLPRDSAVDVVLAAAAESPECAASRCMSGRCGPAPTPTPGPLVIAASCPGDTACAGDELGTWTYRSACITEPSVELRAECPEYRVVSGSGTVLGTLSLDGARVVQDLTVVASLAIEVPASCAPLGCSLLQLELIGLVNGGATCSEMTGGGCACDVTSTIAEDWSVAYSVASSRIVGSDGVELEFCSAGGVMRYRELPDTATALGVLELRPMSALGRGALGATTALAVMWAATAHALHSDVEQGRRLAQEASFDEALAALARAEASTALTRDDLVVLLESRALVFHALGREGDLERTLRELASLEPTREPGRDVPPDLAERIRASGRTARQLSLGGSGTRRDGTVTLVIEVQGDTAGLVREVRAHTREGAAAFRVRTGREHTLDVPPGAEVAWYAEAVGPGGAIVATAGSAEAPRSVPPDVSPRVAAVTDEDTHEADDLTERAGEPDEGDGPGPWPYVIGASVILVAVGVVLAVLLVPGSDTIPGSPSHPL